MAQPSAQPGGILPELYKLQKMKSGWLEQLAGRPSGSLADGRPATRHAARMRPFLIPPKAGTRKQESPEANP